MDQEKPKEIKPKKADDLEMLFDAVKELTTEIGKLKKEVSNIVGELEKWRKAGKF